MHRCTLPLPLPLPPAPAEVPAGAAEVPAGVAEVPAGAPEVPAGATEAGGAVSVVEAGTGVAVGADEGDGASCSGLVEAGISAPLSSARSVVGKAAVFAGKGGTSDCTGMC